MDIHFAPLQGYADHIYRRLHASLYGGISTYYSPFIRIEKGAPRRQDIAHLQESIDDGINIIAQIIFNATEEFMTLTAALKDLGISKIDLNLGCPYPMQTGKGRGTAMIANVATMAEISELINADTSTAYSLKMRLGQKSPDEWKALMPVLNATRLEHVTLHPRIAKQMYGGELFADEFPEFLQASKNPVIWNGDILSLDDISRISAQYPQLKAIMVGRGLLARPSLAAEWLSGEEWSAAKRMERLMQFHNQLFEAYESTLCGQTQILQKIKPFWDYLEPEIGHKPFKAIHKAATLDKYRAAVGSI